MIKPFPSENELDQIQISIDKLLNEISLDIGLNRNLSHGDALSGKYTPKNYIFLNVCYSFNFRLQDTLFSYFLIKYYYEKNAKVSPSSWNLNYFIDDFYFRFFSCVDIIYRILNIHYDMKINHIEEAHQFERKVINNLKSRNTELYNFFLKIKNYPAYQLGSDLRNHITHNFDYNTSKTVHTETSIHIAFYSDENYLTNIENLLDIIKEISVILNAELFQNE